MEKELIDMANEIDISNIDKFLNDKNGANELAFHMIEQVNV